MNNQQNVAILTYPNVELVDMNGPIDVFLHANTFNDDKYNIYTVASSDAPIRSEGGIVTITPTHTIDNCPKPDIIVIPGITRTKDGTFPGVADKPIIEWIKSNADITCILSVCIGIYTLVETKLLVGKRVTTHYLSINDFHQKHNDVTIVKNVRFVEDGNILTTGGITSGMDGALWLVEKYDGSDIAQQVADVMVYNREASLPPYTILPPYYP